MSSTLEIAKSLLRKGNLLKDEELINMANEMLEGLVADLDNEDEGFSPEIIATTAKKKAGRPKKVVSTPATRKTGKTLADDFTRQKPSDIVKSVPVNMTKKFNTWVDDGVEARSKADITPDYIPTTRDRKPIKKVQKICGLDENGKRRDDEGCGKKIMVNPNLLLNKDLFICDDCISKKIRK